jgi:hypothetical protein
MKNLRIRTMCRCKVPLVGDLSQTWCVSSRLETLLDICSLRPKPGGKHRIEI